MFYTYNFFYASKALVIARVGALFMYMNEKLKHVCRLKSFPDQTSTAILVAGREHAMLWDTAKWLAFFYAVYLMRKLYFNQLSEAGQANVTRTQRRNTLWMRPSSMLYTVGYIFHLFSNIIAFVLAFISVYTFNCSSYTFSLMHKFFNQRCCTIYF